MLGCLSHCYDNQSVFGSLVTPPLPKPLLPPESAHQEPITQGEGQGIDTTTLDAAEGEGGEES